MHTLVTLIALLLAAMPALAQRDTLSLGRSWRFARSAEGPWTTVHLPHDFQISQPWVAPAAGEQADHSDVAANIKSRLSARGFKEMGCGYYRRTLHAPAEWAARRVLLEFEGIMLVGDVYLNGRRIGGTDYGYVGFELDVSSLLCYGEDNLLEVVASTMEPRNSRWYTGGGLYRDVSLVLTPRDIYFERHPLRITTQANRTVSITAELSRHAAQGTFALVARIVDAAGRTVATSRTPLPTPRMGHRAEYALPPITLHEPHLWSCEQPYLYRAEVEIVDSAGTVRDRVSDEFGVRTVEITSSRGLLLNGKKVLLKGNANHHTLGSLGAAAFPRAIEKRIRLLKQFGFNHIRTSHNPYSRDLYRLCDRYGMLVVDELYDKWTQQHVGGRGGWLASWQRDLPEWVKRDRNHPSVVMWSLGNELQQDPTVPFGDWGVTAYRLQRDLLHRYDTTRLVTVAMHPRYRNWDTDSIPADLAMITDVQAYNYRYMYFPSDGRRWPWMKFYQSEASLAMMGPNFFDMDREKVIGLAYWGMIDYLGESLGWPAKGWHNGVFDIALQPKPMAFFLKSMFGDEPVVHIGVVDGSGDNVEWNGVQLSGDPTTDHWNRTPGERYTVVTYTNASEVELRLNGKRLGVRRNSADSRTRNRIEWPDVAYAPGTLEAIARTDGRVVARHKIETAGRPVALRLETDNDAWAADGTDLQHLRITAVDAKGRRCPLDSREVALTLSGDATLQAVGNGNIASDELPAEGPHHLFRGTTLAILRAGTTPSRVTLTATAPGLKPATATMVTR